MTNFDSLGLSPKALRAVELMGYEQPTPVQEKTIPLVLEGRDVIAGAQTGTGKTAAFCLPAMDKLGHADKKCGPLMLVITPTRELADQIGSVCNQIAKISKHNITTVVGGVSYNPQREALKRGTDVLIATPGRLEDLMHQEAAMLDQVTILVLDEADRMLDMGFLPSVSRIVKACTAPHQTLLFSATIDDRVLDISKKMLVDPATVEIARKGQTADTVDQYLVRIAHAAKPSALKAVLKERGAERVIVFARTRHRADACARRINRMGFKAEALHSDKSQAARRKALEQFAAGKVNVLVATDVLARGIDVDQVDYVVNYDIPTQPEDYIHRIGRTGRAGSRGYAVTLFSPENQKELDEIQKLIKREIPEIVLKDFDVEAVEEDAKARSLQLQARRLKDPEVTAVMASMAKKKRKERKKAKAAQGSAKNQELVEMVKPVEERKPSKASRHVRDNATKVKRSALPGRTARKDDDARPEKPSRKGGEGRSSKAAGQSIGGRSSKMSRTDGESRSAKQGKKKPLGKSSPSSQKRQGKPGVSGAKEKPSRKQSGKKDFRPGRAHRAAVASKREQNSWE